MQIAELTINLNYIRAQNYYFNDRNALDEFVVVISV